MLYLITYGLKREEACYGPFFEALESLGQCLEVSPGAVLCSSLVSAAVIAAELKPHLSRDDRLVVVQMMRGHCAGLLGEAQKKLVVGCLSRDPAGALELNARSGSPHGLRHSAQ